MKQHFKRATAMLLCLLLFFSYAPFSAFAASKTGVGMAEWALRAYNEGWKYVFGGSEVGTVDCSGLIRSYIKGGGGAKALLDAASVKGDISTMPNVHGLGLWCEGHAGVYVGKNDSGVNMAVDARNSRVNVVYSTMDSRSWNPWTKWFKVAGVTYPTTGWETFNGKQYYYYNGEYVTGIFTVDGVDYDFGKSGALIGRADATTTTTTTTTTKPTTTTTAKPTTTTSKATTTTTKATTTTTAAPSLKQGMSGSEVTKMQKRLQELGYLDAKATGYFGNQTAEALKAFQRAASLTPDGIAGRATLAALYADNAPKRTTTTATTTTATTTTKATTTTTTSAAPVTTTSATTSNTSATSGAQNTSTAQTTSAVSTTATTTTTTRSALEMLLDMDASVYNELYVELDFGSSGEPVKALQTRLTELGYYDHGVDGYYGVFARVAVMSFQVNAGLTATGIADPETQALLYSEYAPDASSSIDIDALYGNALYGDASLLEMDEGDYYDESMLQEDNEVVSLAESEGLDGLGTRADLSAFARQYGISGALQTLGISAYAEPVTIIVQNGESFELDDELDGTINDCVFF